MKSVKQNLNHIQSIIDQQSPEQNINMIAVTKYVSNERKIEAYDAGLRHFGENRVEGFNETFNLLADKKDCVFHFIGTLQSRKVKEIIDYVDYIHSVDRLSLAKEINKRASRPIDCLIQVNVSGEESKHGIPMDDLDTLIERIVDMENIHVVGLMTMAPINSNDEQLTHIFSTLKNLKDEINNKYDTIQMTELSMGMSQDYHIALKHGATMLRIGTTLVGE
ncbi:YggS family pyridoxal phosphate-dependent enzyme [Abyssicoccus albus]|uniref:Pyridoxal phosphate homeostasis protein n=1 Tax=Abyssicoccus albus TaxID=1817405 RepID=A0A1Q1G1Y7_9BACL|nr:YggS family pyridoxal phosphate-dependent enzyme [Abyssicoccus albus]AQL56373.1 YggS family pyridoxal phosphate enzyme [Abyssicoccus albus]RPF57795.1 hypothetical protein EDD62_0430 [Abyssicoccus albus]